MYQMVLCGSGRDAGCYPELKESADRVAKVVRPKSGSLRECWELDAKLWRK